ncbi:hypothetical protein, partial [Pseudoalteromonas sp.]|uniref:hypothetical protein n=1 Tax=Pseudoalteromonas sp. TaxID=53249 RepID=UPI002629586E
WLRKLKFRRIAALASFVHRTKKPPLIAQKRLRFCVVRKYLYLYGLRSFTLKLPHLIAVTRRPFFK